MTRRRPGRPPQSRPPPKPSESTLRAEAPPFKPTDGAEPFPVLAVAAPDAEATESHQRPPISDGAGIPTPQVTNPAEWVIAAIVGGTKVDPRTLAKTRAAEERGTPEQREHRCCEP